jgi:hypothetical protein
MAAVMLPLHVIALQLLTRDVGVMGAARSGTEVALLGWVSIGLIVACVAALGLSWLGLMG